MRIFIHTFLMLMLFAAAGCGGAPVKAVQKTAEEIKGSAGETAEKAVGKKEEIKKEVQSVKKEAGEKAEEVKEKTVPKVPPVLLVKVTLVNRLSLQGIIVRDSKKELTLKTEIGEVSLKKERILSVQPQWIPKEFEPQ